MLSSEPQPTVPTRRVQTWNPFSLEPIEFAKLNFDFHPKAVRHWLKDLGFTIERTLTLSHFRVGLLKRLVPTGILVFFDSLFQWTGAWWQFTPSVFVKAKVEGRRQNDEVPANPLSLFKCPDCGHAPLIDKQDYLECPSCQKKWGVKDGIFDFREPLEA